MIGNPFRAWRRRRRINADLMHVPLRWRALFEGDIMPPGPPPPATLRQAADELDALAQRSQAAHGSVFAAVDAFRTDTADWLRRVAALLPEPYRYQEFFAPQTPLLSTEGIVVDARGGHGRPIRATRAGITGTGHNIDSALADLLSQEAEATPELGCDYLAALHRAHGLCDAQSPRLNEYEMPYTCTRTAGHEGVHRAEGPDDEVFDTWPQQ